MHPKGQLCDQFEGDNHASAPPNISKVPPGTLRDPSCPHPSMFDLLDPTSMHPGRSRRNLPSSTFDFMHQRRR